MARLKSAYRDKPPEEKIPAAESEPEPNVPKVKIDGEPAEPDVVAHIEDGEPEVVAAIDKAAEADQAKLALKRQIEALHQSEELQRQHQAAAQAAMQQPMSREDKINLWRQQGLSNEEAAWLNAHPAAIDHPELTTVATAEAMQAGHERNSPGYFEAIGENFDRHMNQLRRGQAAAPAPPTPQFFKPPPPKPEPEMPTESSYVSAPVSRQAPSPSGGYQPAGAGRVNLSPEEVAIAQASGVSLKQYAEGKLRLEQEKRNGLRQR